MPAWLRRSLITVVAVFLLGAALLLAASWALPAWVERQGIQLFGERLGREVTVGRAKFDPWRWALTVEQLRIAAADRQASPALVIKRAEVAVSMRSLWHAAPVLSSVTVDGLQGRLTLLPDGRTDWDDVIARVTAPSPDAADDGPADLALYNIELRGGHLQVDDRTASMVHEVRDLQLGVPFLSTLPADVEVHVQPKLAGRLNGVAFRSEGQARPFAQTRSASVTVRLEPVDLSAYRAYWPASVPLRLSQGTADATLSLQFEQPAGRAPEVKLSGVAGVRQLHLQRRTGEARDAQWQDWLSWASMRLELLDVQPLKRQVQLGALTVQQPAWHLWWDRDGQLWWPTVGATQGGAGVADDSGRHRPVQGTSSATPAAPWRVSLQRLALQDARLVWIDERLPDSKGWEGRGIDFSATGVAWPLSERSFPMTLAGRVFSQDLPADAAGAEVKTQAKLGVGALDVGWQVRGLAAEQFRSALSSITSMNVSGELSGAGRVITDLRAGTTALSFSDLQWENAKLSDGTRVVAGAGRVALDRLGVDLVGRSVSGGVLAVQGPQVQVERGADGRWNWERWVGVERSRGTASSRAPSTSGEPRPHFLHVPPVPASPGHSFLHLRKWGLDSPLPNDGVLHRGRDALVLRAADAVHVGESGAVMGPRRASGEVALGAGAVLPVVYSNPNKGGRGVLRLEPVSESASESPGSASAVRSGRDDSSGSGRVALEQPWRWALGELAISQGEVALTDAATRPLAGQVQRPIGIQGLSLRAKDVAWDGRQLQKPVSIGLEFRMRRPDANTRSARTPTDSPRLRWDGQLAAAPWRASGQLKAERLPLHWADPYLDPAIGLQLQRAEGSFNGQFEWTLGPQGHALQAGGEALVGDLRLRQTRLQDGQRRAAEDLLSWQALRLNGLKLAVAPGQSPNVSIQQAQLEDFYARLIINEAGRLNLRDLRPNAQGESAATAAVGAASVPASAAASTLAEASTASASPSTSAAPAPPTASATSASSPIRLSIADTRLTGGRVDFNDRFIKPSYSARLSELTGTLGAFDASSDAMAPLQLKGKVEGTGLLDIKGTINPSGSPLTLDIVASASDIELAPLSPYAGKYAGYAIERGKLSTEVHYRIDPSGLLTADNKVVLNQLSFGERIDSPSATQLPVRLAVTLLKDRNGVIDVNLPISGSINDPQFSLGSLIGKVIANLIRRALTAPFSLLGQLGTGREETSQLPFAPGSAELTPDTLQRLEPLARALADKPSLQLSITGWVDPDAERRAVQAQRLEEALIAERRRELRRQQFVDPLAAAQGASSPTTSQSVLSDNARPAPPTTTSQGRATATGTPNGSTISTGAAPPARTEAPALPAAMPATGRSSPSPAIVLDDIQRARLLKVVYEAAKLPDKPRNLLGLTKDLPPADMRTRLMDSYTVTDDQLRSLALDRAVAVRDALIELGVSNARLFLSAPKLHRASDRGETAAGEGAPSWQPHVDLSLSAQ